MKIQIKFCIWMYFLFQTIFSMAITIAIVVAVIGR